MFGVSQLGPHSFIFSNSITDAEGLVEKIKDCLKVEQWINVGVSPDQCMDVKINHERSNRYIKDVSFHTLNNDLPLYISNSIKMAFWSTSDIYCNAYKVKNNKDYMSQMYKQEPSSIFDEAYQVSQDFTAILFLNESSDCSETIVIENGIKNQFTPKKGSVLIIPPGCSYKIGPFDKVDQYYCVYNFNSAII
jgi:hypothetical protein